MLHFSTSSRTATHPTLLQRVSDALDLLGCDHLRARSAGPHVVLGLCGGEPYARLTPLGGTSFGLAFCTIEAPSTHTRTWEPLLLVDDLLSVIEHALVVEPVEPVERVEPVETVEPAGDVVDCTPRETGGRSRSAM